MNRKVTLNYFDNMETGKNSRYCWNKYRSYLSKKYVQGDSKLILIKYLLYVPDPTEANKIPRLIQKFKAYSSFKKIKQYFSVKTKFLLKPITMYQLRTVTKTSLMTKQCR